MQYGDLAEFRTEALVIVLEGVLALVVDEHQVVGRFRKRDEVTGYSIIWHEIPLKRLVMISNLYPNYAIEVVTFRSDRVAELAATFLDNNRISISEVRYQGFEEFCTGLRFRPEVRAVYDSEPERLDRYGQHGVAVVRGEDF
jgi:hypothetical protein